MLQSFKLAIKSIWSNKMRSFLTMLGIIIGVASVIILVSLVNAYMSYMTESFASLGTNQISVNMVNLPSRSVAVYPARQHPRSAGCTLLRWGKPGCRSCT